MPIRLLKGLLAATIIIFALASGYVAILAANRQAALQKISRYDVAWTVGQSVSEFMRLEHQLAAFAIPGSEVPLEEVQLRLDIMFSRIQTFQQTLEPDGAQRSLRLFFESNPEHDATLRDFREALEAVDAVVFADRPPNSEEVLAALETLRPFDARLTSLTSAAMGYAAALADSDRRDLQTLSRLSTALAAVFITCGVALVILLILHNRLLGRAHSRSQDLANRLTGTMEDLRVQNVRFDAALNNMPQALCTFDAHGRLAVFNERFLDLVGTQDRLRIGMSIDQVVTGGSATFRTLFEQQRPLLSSGKTESIVFDTPDDRSFSLVHSPLPGGGWLATYEDISDRRRAAARIAHMAHHDALTDLPNRILFHEQLSAALDDARHTGSQVALFFLDFDEFKDVNDSLGHHVGDQLLRAIADRLVVCAEDDLHVSRFGGDEFALFTVQEPGRDYLQLASWLIGQLSRPYEVDGREIKVGVSIGLVESAPAEDVDPRELFRRADLALYKAKADGRGCARRYEQSLDEALRQRKNLEQDLGYALERRQFVVHYQPIIDAATQMPTSYEALLRWRHPELGMVPPAVFIPVAEQSGAISALGEWVLQQACTEAVTWESGESVAVNLSAIQLRDPMLVDWVATVLRRTGLAPARLELEITESVLLEASELTLTSLKRLKAMGVRIAMDDFGTGYSSLSSMRSFPFDKIKIDRSFVKDLPGSSDAKAIVQLIVQLGRQLGMRTTAEGVETEDQAACLKAMSCSELQGYLFDRPNLVAELSPSYRPIVSEAKRA